MSAISNIIGETILQVIGGIAIGTFVDFVIPKIGDGFNCMFILGGQVIAGGFLASWYFDMLRRRGYNEPTLHAIPFLVGFIATQSKLLDKMKEVQNYLKNFFVEFQFPSSLKNQTTTIPKEQQQQGTKIQSTIPQNTKPRNLMSYVNEIQNGEDYGLRSQVI